MLNINLDFLDQTCEKDSYFPYKAGQRKITTEVTIFKLF